jgi:hypothetical protein
MVRSILELMDRYPGLGRHGAPPAALATLRGAGR